MTLYLVIIVFYLMALIAHRTRIKEDYNKGDNPKCFTLLECFLNTIDLTFKVF